MDLSVLTKADWSSDDDLEKIWVAYKNLLWKLFRTAKNFLVSLVYYMFLIWVFMSVFDSQGFERTLIILLIGVFYVRIKREYYGISKNTSDKHN